MSHLNNGYKFLLSLLLFLVLVFLFSGIVFFSRRLSLDYSFPSTISVAGMKLKHNQQPYAYTIFFDNYGFDPNQLTVPIGTIVKIKNIANVTLNFQPLYGQPNQNDALSLGDILPGQVKSFLADRKGIWQYEANHNPSIRGEIGVANNSTYSAQQLPDAMIKYKIVDLIYDDYGFLPNELRVPLNTKIRLINQTTNTEPGVSNFEQVPGTEPINSSLNLGIIAKGQAKTFNLNTKGIWLLEDSYQPSSKAISQIEVY